MRILSRSLLLLAALAPLAPPASAVTWVDVGDPRNAPDTATNCDADDCGSVSYAYAIGKVEVTNAQYAEFLNAVAASDPGQLYSPSMASDPRGGIVQSGTPGAYSYVAKAGRENNPVVFVSLYDALRFANWLGHGQPTGPQGAATTEDGAYTITPAGIAGNTITRNVGATIYVPSENEWYKAAYYDAATTSYFEYPTGSDVAPSSDPPPGGASSANYYDGTFALTGSATFVPSFNYLSDAGAYPASASPYGTLDQGGNVQEWTERIVDATHRRARGGSWDNLATNLAAPGKGILDPFLEADSLGFRVAMRVPEPAGAGGLAAAALAILAARRRRPVPRA